MQSLQSPFSGGGPIGIPVYTDTSCEKLEVQADIITQHLNMAFQITTLNNRAAIALAKGQEKEAIECLRETFDLLSAGANNQAAQQAHHDDDEYDRGQHKASALLSNVAVAPQQHTTSVTPVLNDTSVSVSPAGTVFVYNCGFALTPHRAGVCSERDISVKCATVIYNMALAYHRLILLESHNPRHSLIFKAATLYQQAIKLSLLEINSRRCNTDDDAVLRIAVASYNNLGQINADFQCDYYRAKQCFESVSCLFRRIACELQHTHLEHLLMGDEWQGILLNLALIDILSPGTAAAA